MTLQFKPVPVGDMAGSLALHIKNLDITQTNEILDYAAHLILIYTEGDNANETNDIIRLRQNLSERHQKTTQPALVLVTHIPAVTSLWYAVDRVVLVTTLDRYLGVPAHEIHFEWTPEDTTYPVVAPLGAQATHIYATTSKGNFTKLIEWARHAPYPIGVIPHTL